LTEFEQILNKIDQTPDNVIIHISTPYYAQMRIMEMEYKKIGIISVEYIGLNEIQYLLHIKFDYLYLN